MLWQRNTLWTYTKYGGRGRLQGTGTLHQEEKEVNGIHWEEDGDKIQCGILEQSMGG
jgi:hypothetical protein